MPCHPRAGEPSATWINRLVLIVTDACNLNCGYCYARLNAGGRHPVSMDPATARIAIRRLLTGRSGCNLIQFFGGEPSLNVEAIEAAIEETLTLFDSGQFCGPRPRFVIVTNGVFRDPARTFDLIQRYRLETTVSLDGPGDLHDALRPRQGGRGTFDDAVGTVTRLVDARLPINIESVYTALHIQRGFSLVELFGFCRELGVPRLIFDVAYPPAPPELNPLVDPFFPALLDHYRDAVDWWFTQLLATDEKSVLRLYFQDLLLPLLHGQPAVRPSGECAAAQGDLTVAPTGELFACQLFYPQADYRLGNVVDGEYPGIAQGFPTGADDLAACRGCFCRNWCQPCPALNRACSDLWHPPERECEVRRLVMARIAQWAFARLEVPENDVTAGLRQAATAFHTTVPSHREGRLS